MRVAINGAAGRMGKLITKIAIDEGLKISQAFDINEVGRDAGELAGISKLGVKITHPSEIHTLDCDIAIDFSTPSSTLNLVREAERKGIKLVIGTTGHNEEQKKVIMNASKKIPIVMSPNFSIGVNVFWKIVERAIENLGDYDIEILEIHHRFKKDAPSGTALKTGEIIREVLKKKGKDVNFIFGRHGESLRGEEVGILALRGGDVVGEHYVYFIGFGERIEINHKAWSRESFARGAIKAAKWINDIDDPGLYTMSDVLGL